MPSGQALDDLPSAIMRDVGEKWLREYGHLIKDDPAFVAAAVYRMMRLAKSDPDAAEIVGLIGGEERK